MEDEEFIKLPACSGSEFDIENTEPYESVCEPNDILSPRRESDAIEDCEKNATLEIDGNVGSEGTSVLPTTDNNIDLGRDNSTFHDGVELTEAFEVTKNLISINSKMCTDNGVVAVEDEYNITSHIEDQHVVGRSEADPTALSGVKRPRTTIDDEQPSVHVTYNALTRESKQKLEELLQQWSQWHAKHCLSLNDSTKGLESGKGTYFPALLVGSEKPCAVSYWMDDLSSNKKSKDSTALDGKTVPLYDRAYTFALTSSDCSNNFGGELKVIGSSRCFNCGSYGHSLKDCPKPRDSVAVNIARKQHKGKRTHNASSRNPTRYYQNSPKGKYDGLKPGVLDPGTRRLLGLGELDPPPWLNRMRVLGYPPGYLDADADDLPSGITIFEDEEIEIEAEEGEIHDKSYPEPTKKMSVEFPGINAPIPEHADNWRWAATSSSLKPSRASSYNRHNRTPEITNRVHFLERQLSRDVEHERHNHRSMETINRRNSNERLPSSGLEDDGPPGCGRDPGMSPSLSKRFRDGDSKFSAPSPSHPKGSTYERYSSRQQR